MIYGWPYLKETRIRGKFLFSIIKPYLREEDKVLDVCCGYSPLANPLLEAEFHITGFDIHPSPIQYLKDKAHRGDWYQASCEEASFTGFSVFLLLGATVSWDISFHSFLSRALESNEPRLILLDVSIIPPDAVWIKIYDNVIAYLQKKGYKVVSTGKYESMMKAASKRNYSLMERQK